jgi:amino acid adenylation domain-containing protein
LHLKPVAGRRLSDMGDLGSRIGGLTAAERALLEARLRQTETQHNQLRKRRSHATAPPLSFGQQRFWFIDQWERGNPAYNTTLAFRLEGPLDATALDRSLTEVARRHEALRTTYAMRGDALVQLIAEPAAVTARRATATSASVDVTDPDVLHLMSEMAAEPFDLRRGPLWRSALLRLAPQRHLLVVTIHHSVFDGWSSAVLTRELFTLYEAFAAGRPSPLPELAVQYGDFAIWQHQQLQGERLHRQLEYWRHHLADLTTLDLPTDYVRPAKQTFAGAAHELSLPPALVEGLRTLSRDEGATLFMTLLAAFQTLLHRYTGQTDIVVGTPIAGRTHAGLEPLIGFFVNMLVLRTNTAGNPSFRTLLRQVRHVAVDAFAHQDVPFEKLVEALHPPRDPSRNPLFQIVFALQNAPRWAATLPDLTVTPVDAPRRSTRFDLEVHLHERDDGLRAQFVYNTALFTGDTISRLATHFHTLLDASVRTPDKVLSYLPLLAPAERKQILNDWSQTSSEYPRNAAIDDLFQTQAETTPNAIAVSSGAGHLTYRQLDERANQLAHHLIALGVGRDVLVGVYLERSIEMVVAVLATLKAGGAYVPLDPTYPRERLAFMLQDADVRVLLTDTNLQTRLPAHRASVICLDRHRFDGTDGQNPEVRTSATSLAYVMYTSGSTGQPKGVAVNHRGVIRLVVNTNLVRLGPGDRLTQLSNPSFDAATFEIWGALLNGGTLVIIPRDVSLSPTDFERVLQEQSISTVFLPTALFHQIASLAPGVFRGVRDLLIGGDVCDPTAVRRVLQAGAPSRVVNAYGPTESTTFTTYHCVEEVDDDARSLPIGRPISNTSVYILDAHLQPVPVGVVGELYIGGDGLARGYLNRPDLTADRFIQISVDGIADARLYKSGDFARYLSDGSIDFVGRIDGQVKIRGFRVELQEIEAALAQQPGVANAVVIPVKREHAGVTLAAYVVPAAGAHVEPNDLRNRLRETVPEYMVPSTFVMVDAIPMTPNGKANRALLSAMQHDEVAVRPTRATGPSATAATSTPIAASTAATQFVAPRSQLESQLARIWEELLGIAPIGVMDNFFDLGGHSLLLVQLIARIEQRFDKTVPVALLFESPTIEALANALNDDQRTRSSSSLIPLNTGGSLPPFFWIHGDSSNAVLSALLGPDRPLFALEHQAHDGQPARHTEVETIATQYLEEIRTVQPHGPYLLGGFSFGGVIAFEMAQQLSRRHEDVDLLFLLDPSGKEATLEADSCGDNGNHSTLWDLLAAARTQIRAKTQKLQHGTKMLRCKACVATGRLLPPTLRSAYIIDIYRKALHSYVPQPYSGRVTIYKTLSMEYSAPLDWRKLMTGSLTIHDCDATHNALIRYPHTRAWAATLRDALAKADTQVQES